MTEENLTNTDEKQQEPTAQPETTETPPEPTADDKKFTQAELDAIVKERLDREKKQRDKAAAEAKKKAEEKALAENQEWKKLADEREAELAKIQAELKTANLLELKRAAAAEYELPEALIPRLQGDTKEDIEADAKQLAETLPKPSKQPRISTTNPGGEQSGESDADRRRRLGIA